MTSSSSNFDPRAHLEAIYASAGPATSRSAAEALEAADPLAHYREQFLIADDDLKYLDGNSLGRMPKATVAAV
ncbi:MAG: hypothetical protein ACKOQ8_02585, partial [Micrococcales bacterium]